MRLLREREIAYLNSCFEEGDSRIIVLYGQGSMGKTALVREFTADKKISYYYRARSCSEKEQSYLWGEELRGQGIKIDRYPSFSGIFKALFDREPGGKVLVVDEFQNMVKSGPAFMDELSSAVKEREGGEQVFVILCSSSIGWVENSMLSKIGEASRSLAGLLKIKELPFEELSRRCQGFTPEECVEAYAVLGGAPGLWAHFDDRLTVRENICRRILDPRSLLQMQGERIVGEQLRETGVYNTLLGALASGKHKLNEIYLHTGFSRAKISVYLKNLSEHDLVEKVFSYDTGERDDARKGIYRIANPFVAFCYTFLYPNASKLFTLTPEEFYDRYIGPAMKRYAEDAFKKACAQYIDRRNREKTLPFVYTRTGEWVGKAGDIPIVAQDEEGRTLIGLCSYERKLLHEDYEWLLFCAGRARLRPDQVYLFSAAGFEDKLWEENVRQGKDGPGGCLSLIGMEEIAGGRQ